MLFYNVFIDVSTLMICSHSFVLIAYGTVSDKKQKTKQQTLIDFDLQSCENYLLCNTNLEQLHI